MDARKIITQKKKGKKEKEIVGNVHVETAEACYSKEKNPCHLTFLPPDAFIQYLVYKLFGLVLITRHSGALKYLMQ